MLGLPWYGYNFTCTSHDPDTPCLDNAGWISKPRPASEIQYKAIMLLLHGGNATRTGRDAASSTAWMEYTDNATGRRHQIWYDDPATLREKYGLAKALRMRGVGMWTADAVPEGKYGAEMWEALEEFADGT